jgi:adenosylmethionine-8-amino-7-oxononanoate aminotransferase
LLSETIVDGTVICDVQEMPFETSSFDSIKATELFEHVKNPSKGIEECYRVLKKNGVLLRPLGNIIYIMPPFVIKKREIKKILDTAYEAILQI